MRHNFSHTFVGLLVNFSHTFDQCVIIFLILLSHTFVGLLVVVDKSMRKNMAHASLKKHASYFVSCFCHHVSMRQLITHNLSRTFVIICLILLLVCSSLCGHHFSHMFVGFVGLLVAVWTKV